MKHTHLPRMQRLFLALAITFGVIACALHGTRRNSLSLVAPQEWQKERGPVVPHDSFPRDCATCHEGTSWHVIKKDFVFDHEKETGVPLEGAHEAAECLRCHNDRGPVAEFASQGCAGCHEDVHFGKLGKGCADCHSQEDWGPSAEIVRHTRTRFPLVGSHAAVACFRCHEGSDVGNFDRASTECIDCHRDQLAQATSPDHLAQGWVQNCDQCHIPTTWGGAGFNHATFPLTGQHAVTACTSCHTNGQFAGTPSACVACHQNAFNSAMDPNHVTQNFPTTCQNCHNTSTWDGALFNHSGITAGCAACHQNDYNTTSSPNHAAVGYPNTCQSCHSTGTWENAHFTHTGVTNGCVTCHAQDFNSGANPTHASAPSPTQCQNCHTTRTWAGASFNHTGITSGCVNCHQRDFNSTTSPNHTSAGFPTSCQTCHSTMTWNGATFSHPQFPINNGAHDNLSCQSCHMVPSNYSSFSCIHCHEHNQSNTNNDHDRVSGYTYVSSACYSCHPDGDD